MDGVDGWLSIPSSIIGLPGRSIGVEKADGGVPKEESSLEKPESGESNSEAVGCSVSKEALDRKLGFILRVSPGMYACGNNGWKYTSRGI